MDNMTKFKSYSLGNDYYITVGPESVQVSSHKFNKIRCLSQNYTVDGYARIKMNNKSIPVHHLVAQVCLGPRPPKHQINHKDGNKRNNHPSNLEYVTAQENITHAIKLGLHVASDPKRSGRYKDGRCADRAQYKHNWYMKNRTAILQKTKERYYAKQA